ncbi:HvfC/BufC N-terminal domain-containing protein [Nitratireductor indicus]|uniref:HvfC/BufC N-terminal domain-containing protein n=1 Tax=Nitratireductor indicus TaxID=721133 RepID=UPI0028742736|nr:DNA-binding domain-containing protein [Nitratireductor indicus]MDS1137911.1 DNA-binding domain-containing protein [Nitratireductor indicus]
MSFSPEPGKATSTVPVPYGDAFSAAVLSPDRPEPASVSGPRGKSAVKRFNVYRNNVTHGLVTALGEIFPATAALVGGENFAAIALAFLRTHPPRSPLVFEYGHDFADFLQSQEPLRHLPYLPDVARLERAWLDAYHAADAAPLAADTLARIPSDKLADTRFTPHPAMVLLASPYAIHSIFIAHRPGPMPERLQAGRPEAVLVTRPALTVELHLVQAPQWFFFEQLARGETLGDAAAAVLNKQSATDAPFDLASAIGLMITSGAFSGCAIPSTIKD